MRRRIAAAAVLAIGLALGTAGCTFFAPQATLIHYDASDGVSLTVGKIELRNAFVISPTGQTANFVGVLINTGDSDQTVKLQYVSHAGGTAKRTTIKVDAAPNSATSYGNPGVPQLQFNSIDSKPGALFTVFVQYDGVTGKNVQIPVLNGTESAYKHLVPTPTPTPIIVCGPTKTAGGASGIKSTTPKPDPTSSPTAIPVPGVTPIPIVGCPNPFATAAPVTK